MNSRVKVSSMLLAACTTVVMSPSFAKEAEKAKEQSSESKVVIEAVHSTPAVSKLSKEWKGQEIVFTSSVAMIDGSWAWVQAVPATKDGKQHFEGLEGVMHKVKGKWQLAQWVPDDVASAGDPAAAFKTWRTKFVAAHPGCPEKIFPAKFASK